MSDDTSLGEIAARAAVDASGDFSAKLGIRVDQIYSLYYRKLDEFFSQFFEGLEEPIRPLGSDFGSLFHKFAWPDPDDADQAVQGFVDGKLAMTRNVGTVDAIARALMHSWEGDAADKFQTYLTETRSAVELQRDALEALRIIQEDHQRFVVNARHDILDIADHAIEALQAYEVDSGGLNPLGVALSLGAAVLNVAAAASSGGTSLAITAAVMGAGSNVVGIKEQTEISGSNPMEIIETTKSAVADLEAAVKSARKVTIERIHAAGEAMQVRVSTESGEGTRLAIRPPTPAIVRHYRADSS